MAVRDRRSDRDPDGLRAPIGRGGHHSVVRREPDDERIPPVALAHDLPDVELALRSELRGASIAEVGVVLPDDDLARPSQLAIEVLCDHGESVRHVPIAQVPGRGRPTQHAPVVLLGRLHEPGVHLDGEGELAPSPPLLRLLRVRLVRFRRMGKRQLAQLDELLRHRILARRREPEPGTVGVRVQVDPVVLEARVARAGTLRRGDVDPLEVPKHDRDRRVETVEIEAVEADVWCVHPEPADEVADVSIAPHPLRESLESAERILRALIRTATLDEAVHALRVRPIRLDGDGIEALLQDEPLGDRRTLTIELVSAVRRLPEKNEARVADLLEEPVVRPPAAVERDGGSGELNLFGGSIVHTRPSATRIPRAAAQRAHRRGEQLDVVRR